MVVLAPHFDLFKTGSPDIFLFRQSANPADSGVGDPRWLVAIAKLKRGISVQQAQAAMEIAEQHLAQEFPGRVQGHERTSRAVEARSVRLVFQPFVPLTGGSRLRLTHGVRQCRQSSARSSRLSPQRDWRSPGIRASGNCLVRQLLTESIVLSFAGGLGGLLLSIWGIKLFDLLSPSGMPRTANAPMDGRILLFTFGICILTGIVFGLAPAFRASKNDVNETLRGEGRTTDSVSRHRTRNFLVIAEIAAALVLLTCAGLMINTLTRILRTNPGFSPEHLVTAQVRLTGDKYIDSSDPQHLDLYVIRPPVTFFFDRRFWSSCKLCPVWKLPLLSTGCRWRRTRSTRIRLSTWRGKRQTYPARR